jgi:DNA-binding SARP family transcriptional activator/Tfp pilus assembly protein PilF
MRRQIAHQAQSVRLRSPSKTFSARDIICSLTMSASIAGEFNSDGSQPVLEIKLLGPFRTVLNGRLVEDRRWSRGSARTLIKLLALQPHHQLHREQICEMLWPDLGSDAALNNLNKAIHAARRALEPDLGSRGESGFIITQSQQVALRSPGELLIDAVEFEQLGVEAIRTRRFDAFRRALAMYESDLLPENLYDDWVYARREQLRSLYFDLLVGFAQLEEATGNIQNAIALIRQLLSRDQSNEAAHRCLMRLYALTGNPSQAIQQFRSCVEALKRELETEPDPSTVQLLQQIQAGQIEATAAATKGEARQTLIDNIAVLPFTNETNSAELLYLSDGISESVINALSRLPKLKVKSWSAVSSLKLEGADVGTIARQLNVRAVLTGRVLSLGSRLVVRVELVDGEDGSQLWGEHYNRTISDTFQIENEIASEISEKLLIRLTGEERVDITKRYTQNPAAHQAYLKGCYYWNKRSLEGVQRGIELFHEAVRLDPDYALAYVGLANTYTKLGDVGIAAIPPRDAFAKAKLAAVRALELDNRLAEAHTALAHLNMHDYEWAEADREFTRALQLSPNYAIAHDWYAYFLLMTGRDNAMTEMKAALDLEPLSLPINTDYGELLLLAREHDRAIEQLSQTLEMDRHYCQARTVLARVYEANGDYDLALAEASFARVLSDNAPETLSTLGHLYAVSGRPVEAQQMLDRLLDLANRQYISPYDLALVNAGMGRVEQAFELLERSINERAAWSLYITIDPRLDSLASDDRFWTLVQQVGLPVQRV